MGHVLIIEDEMLVAMHLEILVRDMGLTSVDLAASEAEAIGCADANVPILILSDVKLSEGTGPSAVRAIHRRHGAVPVIYITGNPEECGAHGDDMRIMTKPIHDGHLREAVEAVLGGAETCRQDSCRN
jgi:two-component system, response regulator PdtaR